VWFDSRRSARNLAPRGLAHNAKSVRRIQVAHEGFRTKGPPDPQAGNVLQATLQVFPQMECLCTKPFVLLRSFQREGRYIYW